MATRTYTEQAKENINLSRVTWTGLTNATSDDGSPLFMDDFADASIQVKGTFGTGGSVRIQGSNDGGTTWATLTDPQGNDLNITAAKIEAITEFVEYIRPLITAGDGSTSLTVVLYRRGLRNG